MKPCSCSWWRTCNDCHRETARELQKARVELIPKIEKAEMPGGDQ